MSGEIYINECCSICGKKFADIEDVYVEIEEDNYVCNKCGIEGRLQVTKAMDYSESE